MRRARPTLALIRSLSSGWPRPTYKSDLNGRPNAHWPDLPDLEHPIIASAAVEFPGEDPEPTHESHRSASAAADRTVWEIRDRRAGPAWRGAVVKDDNGDPWLVYADTHNSFHNTAATALAKSKSDRYMPTAADYQLRDIEESKQRVQQWQSDVVLATLRALIAALQGGAVQVELPQLPEGSDRLQMVIAISGDEKDAESLTVDQLHLNATDTSVTLWLEPLNWDRLHKAVVSLIVPLFEADPARADSNYTSDGRLIMNFVVAHSRLAQLVAVAESTGTADGARVLSTARHHQPAESHYADKTTSTRAYVTGEILRSVCGVYFSPSRDTEGLPVCSRCESLLPAAQTLVTLRRRAAQRRN